MLYIAKEQKLLMEHLHANFNRSLRNLVRVWGEIQNGTIHPVLVNSIFHTVDDSRGMELRQLLDVLESTPNAGTLGGLALRRKARHSSAFRVMDRILLNIGCNYGTFFL